MLPECVESAYQIYEGTMLNSFLWKVLKCMAGIPSTPQNSTMAVCPSPKRLKMRVIKSLMRKGDGYLSLGNSGDEYVLPKLVPHLQQDSSRHSANPIRLASDMVVRSGCCDWQCGQLTDSSSVSRLFKSSRHHRDEHAGKKRKQMYILS